VDEKTMFEFVSKQMLAVSIKAWRWNFWLCVMVVLVLSLMPTGPYMPTTGWDKTNHLLAFSLMTVLGCRAYPFRTKTVLVGLLVYGGLIEVLQSFTTYRFAEWGDVLADASGLALGWILVSLLK
jgi:VanZ family protein